VGPDERAVVRVEPGVREDREQDASGSVVDPHQDERDPDDVQDADRGRRRYLDARRQAVELGGAGRQQLQVPQRSDDAEDEPDAVANGFEESEFLS